MWDVSAYQYNLTYYILSPYHFYETQKCFWSTYLCQDRRLWTGHMRVSSCELSERGHVKILYSHSQIKMGKEEIEILTFFYMSTSISENVKVFIWTAISSQWSSTSQSFGICFWEQTVRGLPYVTPSYPSVFHLLVLAKRDRCTGVRTLGQAVWFLLPALNSYHMVYTTVY